MITVGILLIYLAVVKKVEPLLLGPIGFSSILVNLPITGITDPGGLMDMVYVHLIRTGVIPLLIFLGIGTMTDFSPIIANPLMFILGAAAQIGIFVALCAALVLGFSLDQAAAIGIVGGADGPTTIYVASRLAPEILGPVTVVAYSYMALVPIIQPPIIKLLTSKKDRCIEMKKLREVSTKEKVIFPIVVTIVVGLIVPSAAPLVGMLMLGNLFRVSGVMDRLSKSGGNEIMNAATILLGLGIGFMMTWESFLNLDTLKILALGIVAFSAATAGGVLMGQIMSKLSKGRINPMIGAAGVSAVPMAARVTQKMASEERPGNFILMHAMGPNVAGVISSALVAGVLLEILLFG